MSGKSIAQAGRLIWIEPNKMDELSDTSTFNYEDYSICVDLEVRIPKRSACGSRNEVVKFYTNHETAKDKISFFTGTDGFLTTSFTDITAADPNSNKETLGVTSIDITYNSYFYPQVTIKFVDVRGSSLMYPQEDMFKNGSQGSFFKSLFCFPYPEFILKVKGFYGKQVQYELAVEDFKTSFNSETGNFECVVKFIGYMYGIYTDLPTSYIMVAPYAEFIDNRYSISGKKYWDDQVKRGIFVYDDNKKPLHTMVSLRLKIQECEDKLKKLSQNSPNIVRQQKINNLLSYCDTIETAYKNFVNKFSTYYYGEKFIHFYNSSVVRINENDEFLTAWATLNQRIYEFNEIGDAISLEYFGGYDKRDKNELFNSLENKEFFSFDKLSVDVQEDLKKSNLNNDNFYYSLTHNNFINLLSDIKSSLSSELEDINKEIAKKESSIVKETLGFVPNMKNIFKIIFAHIDTFMFIYYKVLENINNFKNLTTNSERSAKKLELNANNSDLIEEADFVPPYPLVIKKTEFNQNETMWPGDYNPAKDMIELKFVESLFNGVSRVESHNKFFENLQTNVTNLCIPYRMSDYVNDSNSPVSIIPSSISDLYFYNNPYTLFTERDNINLYNVFNTLAYRLLDTNGFQTFNTNSAKAKGIIEAINFYKKVPVLKKEGEQLNFINFLKTFNNEKNNEYINDFITFLTEKKFEERFNQKLGNKNNVRYHKGSILNDDFRLPVNFDNVTKTKNDSVEYFPTKNFALTKTDTEKLSFFFDLYKRCNNEEKNNIYYTEGVKQLFTDNFLINIPSYEKREDYITAVASHIVKSSLLPHNDSNSLSANKMTFKDREWKKEWISHMYLEANESKDEDGITIKKYNNKNALEDAVKAITNKDIAKGRVIDPSYMQGASLFGSYIYYAQNTSEEETRNLAKAYLFLEACAPFANDSLDVNKIGFYTDWTMLLSGARKWRYELENGHIKNSTVKNYKLPNKNQSFCVRNKFETVTFTQESYASPEGISLPQRNVEKNESYQDIFSVSTNRNDYIDKEQKKYIEDDGLREEFIRWANGEFKSITNDLELKGNDNSLLTDVDILCLNKIVGFFKINVISEYNISEILKNTKIDRESCTISKILIANKKSNTKYNIDSLFKLLLSENSYSIYKHVFNGDNGLFLALNPSDAITRKLFVLKVENIVVYSPIETRKNKDNELIKESFISFTNKLYSLYKNNNGFENIIDSDDNNGTLTNSIVTRNKDLKLSLYLTLKNLYDRWLCGSERDKWDMQYYVGDVRNLSDYDANIEKKRNCEYNKFFFIDSFYNDISEKIVLNLSTFKEIIGNIITNRVGDDTVAPSGMKFQGMSVYQFMASILQKNSMNFLAVPCFNTYKTKEQIKELFTPYSWFDRGEPKGTSYVALYPHQVSAHLNIEGATDYQYKNDGWDIADINGDFKDTLDIPDLAVLDGGYTMPAFGVTYGKQDQSFFKKITVNMDKPQATEYSIAATLDIANNLGENQKVQTFVGQDLYKVYSNYSYTCTVEMMGNAMITPLMYFQLNNIPMFRGAYMIIKVEHSISQGNMITTFTGVRMAKNKIPFVSANIETEKSENIIGTSDGSSNNKEYKIDIGSKPLPLSESNSKRDKFVEAAIFAFNNEIKEEPIGSNRVPQLPELPVQGRNDNLAWCAIFVGWCAEKAGLNSNIIGGEGSYRGTNWTYGYQTTCNSYYDYYKKLEKLYGLSCISDNTVETKENNPPQKGDLILFLRSNEYESDNNFGHIGIIEKYNSENNKIVYIHGNYSDRVQRTSIDFDSQNIGCFIRPPFDREISLSENTMENDNITNSITNSDNSNIEVDDIIIRTKNEKIAMIKAVITQESKNKHSSVGDKKLTYPAYGILQVRQTMLDEVNRIRNKYSNKKLGEPLYGEVNNLTRDEQVEIFLSVIEYENGLSMSNAYFKTNGKEKTPDLIPWSLEKIAGKWNGRPKEYNRKPNPNYVNGVKTKYYEFLNGKDLEEGDSNGWTLNKAFDTFFA